MKHRKNFCKEKIDREIGVTFTLLRYSKKRSRGYQALLQKVRSESSLLYPAGKAHPDYWPIKTLTVLKNLALHAPDWTNAPESWNCPKSKSPYVVLRSLIRHLLCFYPVPAFADLLWMREPTVELIAWQEIYKKMGRGKSFRKSQSFWSYTRAMENSFLNSPDHFSFEEALIYGVVRGSGGSKALAEIFYRSKVVEYVKHLDFWQEVVRLFTREGEERLEVVTAILDFLIDQKFATREVVGPEGVMEMAAPAPDFSLKGKTVSSVMRRVEKWHIELGALSKAHDFSWRPILIRSFVLPWRPEGKEELLYEWSIEELTGSADLRREGMIMKHCVSSYAGYCLRGRSSIWSMRLKTERSIKHVLTIEIEPRSRKIVQVRGKCNRLMSPAQQKIVEKWASVEQLKLAL